MFCMQFCPKFCAIDATHSQHSSTGQQQKRRRNESMEKESASAVKDAKLRELSMCKVLLTGLEILAVTVFRGEIGCEKEVKV